MNTIPNIMTLETKSNNKPTLALQKPSQKKMFISQLLNDYYKTKCTGTLTFKNDDIVKSINFNAGKIVFATSNIPKEQLSEFLINLGQITYEQLSLANRFVQRYKLSLSQVLIKLGYLEEHKLKSLATILVSNIIRSILTWESPEIVFQEYEELGSELEISKPTIQLLYESVMSIENLIFIKQMIGNLDTPLHLNKIPSKIYQLLDLRPEEAFIISSLDSASYTTNSLISLGSIPEPIVLTTICALIQTGILRNSARNENDSLLTPSIGINNNSLDTRSIMEFFYEINSKVKAINSCVSVYELFEVDDNATIEELQNAYQRLAKKFHPTRQAQVTAYHLDFSFELEYIFQKLTQAINTFISCEKKFTNFIKEKEQCVSHTNPKVEQKLNYSKLSEASNSNDSQKITMRLCYEIEVKYNAIKDGATLYQILGVERDSSQQTLNTVFHRLSQQFNPEKQTELSKYGLEVKAQLQMITSQLNKAFRVLSNPTQKQEYNKQIGMNFVSWPSKAATTGKIQLPNKVTTSRNAIITQRITAIPSLASKINQSIDVYPTNHASSINIENHKLVDNNFLTNPLPKTPVKDKNESPITFYLQDMEFYAKKRV
ncbi:MAG: response regulator [bacterium]|nr:MAG: response regulator [bacterium]